MGNEKLQVSHFLQSQLGSFKADTLIVKSARGCYVYDTNGMEYLDLMGGYWVASLGYGDPEIIRVMTETSSKLSFWHNFETSHVYASLYAEELMACVPAELRGKVLFANTGSGAMENALRVGSAWAAHRNEKLGVAYLDRGYHGSTFLTQQASPWNDWPESITFKEDYFFKITTPVDEASAECALRELRDYLSRGSGRVNVVVTEPVLGVGGMIVPPSAFFLEMRAICDRYDAIWVLDEISTGFGATGTLFAFERLGVVPDILVLGKKIAAGYFPMSCAVISQRVANAAIGQHEFHHGYSSSAHPVGCAVASTVLGRVGRSDFLAQVCERGRQLREGLESILGGAQSVRGLGLMLSVQTGSSRSARAAAHALRERGIYELPEGKYLTFCPPLTITEQQVDYVIKMADECIGDSS